MCECEEPTEFVKVRFIGGEHLKGRKRGPYASYEPYLENAGFIDGGGDPVLIGQPAAIKCLDRLVTNTAITYRQAILDGGLVRDIVETRNLFAADGGTDSVLLVVPGRDNFWMVEAMPPTNVMWQDKKENYYCTVREAVVPVIGRATSIYEITDVTCA